MPELPAPPSILETMVKAALAVVPRVGEPLKIIYEDTRARHAARAGEMIRTIADRTGEQRLSARLQEDPEVDALFVDGVEAAMRTGLQAKRSLLAKVVAAAVVDDAQIEHGQLIVQALRDLDAPQVRALARIRNAEREAEEIHSQETEGDRNSRISNAAREAGSREPTPVISTLVRTGVVLPATLVGGGLAVHRVSDFGRSVLNELEEAS